MKLSYFINYNNKIVIIKMISCGEKRWYCYTNLKKSKLMSYIAGNNDKGVSFLYDEQRNVEQIYVFFNWIKQTEGCQDV